MTKAKAHILEAWIEGRYALGWRGWLAKKLLNPVLNSLLVDNK